MPPRWPRSWPVRIGAPIAFLLAATVAVLLVRDGLRADTSRPARRTPTTVQTSPVDSVPRYYAVRPGDTLRLVALRFGTTADQLVELNPGVDATSWAPGRRLRVG